MPTLLYQGHGSYRITTDAGVVIYIDPFAGTGYDLAADLILVTHEHFDHNHVDLMPHAKDCEIIRAGDLHPSDAEYLSVSPHGIQVSAVQASNANHPSDRCVGFVLTFDNLGFYAAGDTSTTDDMRSGKLRALGLDYAMLPADGRFNMDVTEASTCAAMIGARHTIPVHLVPVDDPGDSSQLFDREKAEAFEAAGRIILEPGDSLVL